MFWCLPSIFKSLTPFRKWRTAFVRRQNNNNQLQISPVRHIWCYWNTRGNPPPPHPQPGWGQLRPDRPRLPAHVTEKRNIHGPLSSCSALWLHCVMGFPWKCVFVLRCSCSLCPTVSKDLMRDLTVAPGSALASPLASAGVVGIMEMPHQWRLLSESEALTSSPWDLADTMDRVAV